MLVNIYKHSLSKVIFQNTLVYMLQICWSPSCLTLENFKLKVLSVIISWLIIQCIMIKYYSITSIFLLSSLQYLVHMDSIKLLSFSLAPPYAKPYARACAKQNMTILSYFVLQKSKKFKKKTYNTSQDLTLRLKCANCYITIRHKT